LQKGNGGQAIVLEPSPRVINRRLRADLGLGIWLANDEHQRREDEPGSSREVSTISTAIQAAVYVIRRMRS